MATTLQDLLDRLSVVEDLEESARQWALSGGRGSLPAEFGTTCELARQWIWRATLLADREVPRGSELVDHRNDLDLCTDRLRRARHWVWLGGKADRDLENIAVRGSLVSPMARMILEARHDR